MRFRRLSALCLTVPLAFAQQSQAPVPQKKLPSVEQTVEVTATRLPEDPEKVPTAIQVFTGDELSSRGAQNLQSALSLATGVAIAPGGDSGPASSVPEFWGLREFDAFLLVVDGIPWGGAFNPALTALNLTDIDRVEVLRGPAPVMYGATSFVGVIQVIHKDAFNKDKTLELYGGNLASGGGAFSFPIPLSANWSSRLTVEGQREGFSDERTSYRRGHGLWRVARKPVNDSHLWFNTDVNWLDQNPASPRPRTGTIFTPLVPVDSNQNMGGAFINDHRATFFGGYDRPAGKGHWYTTASVSPGRQDIFRGFLQDISNAPDNAHGFREQIHLTDFYLDSHLVWKLPHGVQFVAGGDYLHGTGNARGADFDYSAPLDGSFAPTVAAPSDLDFQIHDNRDFFGAYGSFEWSPLERLRFDAGLRINATREHQQVIDGGAGTNVAQTRTAARPGANLGMLFTAWQKQDDSLGLYVNYRDTFKPAAIDFGIGESPAGDLILKPETSRSVEGGMKGRFFDRRIGVEASGFLMDFSNLVVSADIGGLPGLINAGGERFKGFESEAEFLIARDVIARGTYSYHDARFTDFIQDFDGTLTQLAGKQIEMSAHNLFAFGLQYLPERGLFGGLDLNYTGQRFLDKRNRALAEGFANVGLNVGYRTPRWELRLNATNLADRRDPVAESELGDAEYYLLPSRRVSAMLRVHF